MLRSKREIFVSCTHFSLLFAVTRRVGLLFKENTCVFSHRIEMVNVEFFSAKDTESNLTFIAG